MTDADRAREIVETWTKATGLLRGWPQLEPLTDAIAQALAAVRAEARREERERVLQLARKWSGQCVVEAPGNVPSCFDGLIAAIRGQEG